MNFKASFTSPLHTPLSQRRRAVERRLTKALLVFPVALASLAAQAQPATDRPDLWHYGWGWGHMIFGSIMMLLFWGGIVIVIVLAVRGFGGGTSRGAESPPGSRALDILEERYARGEIDKEEFEERKRLLSK
jgi:putative membrane protein